MLRKLTLKMKLLLGFGAVLFLLLVVGILSFAGVSGMKGEAENVLHRSKLSSDMIQKEIDHLQWANKISTLLTDTNVTQVALWRRA